MQHVRIYTVLNSVEYVFFFPTEQNALNIATWYGMQQFNETYFATHRDFSVKATLTCYSICEITEGAQWLELSP